MVIARLGVVYQAWKQGRSALREVEMLQDILFVITLFVTRMVLPICFTLFLGYRLERALNQGAHVS